MKKCENCKTRLENDSRFCMNCSNDIHKEQPNLQVEEYNDNDLEMEFFDVKKSRTKKKIIIGSSTVVTILTLLFVMLNFLSYVEKEQLREELMSGIWKSDFSSTYFSSGSVLAFDDESVKVHFYIGGNGSEYINEIPTSYEITDGDKINFNNKNFEVQINNNNLTLSDENGDLLVYQRVE